MIEFADNEISPVAPGPLRRRRLKRRPALAAPGSQKRSLFHDAQGRFEEISVEHIVIVHKHQQISLGLAYAAQAGRGKTQSFLSNYAGARMPGEIYAIGERIVASIVHDQRVPKN